MQRVFKLASLLACAEMGGICRLTNSATSLDEPAVRQREILRMLNIAYLSETACELWTYLVCPPPLENIDRGPYAAS